MSNLHLPDYTPVYTVSKSVKPRQRVAKLPSWGIEQRDTKGQNQTSPEWNIKWILKPIEANTLDFFLREQAKTGAWFVWTPPDAAVYGSFTWRQARFRCDDWTKQLSSCNIWEVQATFRQVFSFTLPRLGASTGYFALTGFRVAPIPTILRPSTASFALSGSSAALVKSYPVFATRGTFALTGNAIEAKRSYVVDAATGVLVLSGKAADLESSSFSFGIEPVDFALSATPIGTTLEEYPLGTLTLSVSTQLAVAASTFTLSTTPSGTTLSAVGLSTSNSSATLQLLVSPVDFL